MESQGLVEDKSRVQVQAQGQGVGRGGSGRDRNGGRGRRGGRSWNADIDLWSRLWWLSIILLLADDIL